MLVPVPASSGFSRLVFAIDAAVLVFLLVGGRLAHHVASMSYLRTRRGRGRQVLIYGAGVGGALLVRVLLEDRDARPPAGRLRGRRRRPSAGCVSRACRSSARVGDLPALLADGQIAEVIVSIRALDRTRLADAAAICTRARRHASARCASPSRRSDRFLPSAMLRAADPRGHRMVDRAGEAAVDPADAGRAAPLSGTCSATWCSRT